MNRIHVYRTIEISEINKLIEQISDKVVRHCENQYNNGVDKIAQLIASDSSAYKILLLSGPSASGKTTTSQLVRDFLKTKNIDAWCISLDDFFLNPQDITLFDDGTPDYESLNSLDLPLIHKCLFELIKDSESNLPIFNFMTNTRSKLKRKLKIDKNDIIIIEGLHALNPSLLLPSYSDRCLKVYVSISTSYINNDQVILDPKDLRLIRRIIRDHRFRNTHVYETLNMWPVVCSGEKKYIDPFKETSQIFIDSCISYEPCIFRSYLETIIKNSDKSNVKYKQLLEIYDKLSNFKNLDSSIIPEDSILREFVGQT